MSAVQAILAVLAGLLALALAAWLHLRFWVRRLGIAVSYDDMRRVATPDGSAIELRRLQPATASLEPPVLLVHGLAVDHRCLDARPGTSLARLLRDRGRDVWLLTLRSGRRDLTARERERATFTAMAMHDLPTAARAVLAATQSQCIDYVGFSMGGILLYAAAGRSLPESWLRRAVAIGSPGRIGHRLPIARWTGFTERPWLPNVPLAFLSRLVAFLGRRFDVPGEPLLLNRPNVDPAACRQLMVDAVADIPGPLLHEFAQWSAHGGAITAAGQPALDGLRTVRVPALFVVGAADRLGFPAFVRLAFDAWGSAVGTVKQWRVVGRESGAVHDYGHCDLAMGMHVTQEVFAPVCDWLAAPNVAEGA
jgi:pimeloyl-ACP methyl ester carboxylesterase